MRVSVKKAMGLAISVPIGLALTGLVLWIFGIEPAPLDRWRAFPEDWRLFDLITNAMGLLMAFGAIRASYHVIHDLWINGGD